MNMLDISFPLEKDMLFQKKNSKYLKLNSMSCQIYQIKGTEGSMISFYHDLRNSGKHIPNMKKTWKFK